MRILILGGGPAGLYSAILLKKANHRHKITVIERNPADATYGWGIVFSDRTLTALREADYKSYKEITDSFVLWDAIDVRYRGEVIRSGGHVFAGISRKVLLQILQRRCMEVGVEMIFQNDIKDIQQLEQQHEHDLFIAADGVNSLVRARYAAQFEPNIHVERNKFVWLGASRAFDSFTYIFEQNEHGLFQVHAYPFNGTTSTFIVECAEETWRQAGLDKAAEADTIAYCEKLFAGSLRGARLLSNRSLWINFPTVKNKRWHYKNIVLLGDAAHTAHFTIGSGTKLAMEDAIAFVNAFEQHESVEEGLSAYELERRPTVESLQRLAQESLTYFENTRRYVRFEPRQFAFQLLTRSRISYDEMRVRDPHFLDETERWFYRTFAPREEADAKATPPAIVVPPPMLTPLQLRRLRLPNRTALSAGSRAAATNGIPNQRHAEQILRQAGSGAGLVLTEIAAVSAEGRITPGCAGIYCPEHAAAWKQIVDQVHARSQARIALQIGHAGRRGATRPRIGGVDRPLRSGEWPLVSASAIAYTRGSQTPKEADAAERERICREFARAAEFAHEAGFDMLQLHFAQGYFVASFLSPLTNQRADAYGGSLEARLRYPLEILAAARAAWPPEKPLSVALTATDWERGGATVDDAVRIAQIFRQHGCDLVQVLAGQTTIDSEPVYRSGFLTGFSDRIRNEAGVPTMVGGHLTTTDQINTIIAAGRADICILSEMS